MSGITRGDVFYVESYQTEGSEQRPGRPAIIVSNDMCNEFSDVVEVVYLTTKPKNDLPTHVTIRSTSKLSVALCEQITSVSKSRLGDWVARLSEEEVRSVNMALLVSLSIEPMQTVKIAPLAQEEPQESEKECAGIDIDKLYEIETVLRTQRDTYKNLYEALLERLIPVVGRGA